MLIQEGFEKVVDEATQKCLEHFSDRLLAVYITGSIYTNEAIIGESDLDYWGFIADELCDSDKIRVRKIESEIDGRFDAIRGAHINIRSIDDLKRDKLMRFILKYNSVLYFGRDVVSQVDAADCDAYAPNKRLAKGRLPFARKCLSDALQNKCPQCIDKIPENTYLAARKFARYFVLVEGAYFLMAKDLFDSFKQEKVLRGLRENTVAFGYILDLSLAVLSAPLTTGIAHDNFIMQVRPFVEWMFDEIEKA